MKRQDKKENLNSSFFSAAIVHPRREGGGGSPTEDLYGKAPPQRGTFFRCMQRVVISLVEAHERVGKSVISLVKVPKRTNICILWL